MFSVALEIALKKLGIRSDHAFNLKQAREFLDSFGSTYDLIMLDRQLPDGDGLKLCAALRNEGYHGAILVLIVVFIFLMNVRTTAITLTAIPLSFVITALHFRSA